MFAPCRKHAGSSVHKMPLWKCLPCTEGFQGQEEAQLDGDCGALCWTQAECWGAPRGLGTSNLSLPRPGTVAVQREVPMLLCHKCGTLTPQLAAQTGTRRGQQVLSLTGNLLSGVPFHAQEPSCRRGDI